MKRNTIKYITVLAFFAMILLMPLQAQTSGEISNPVTRTDSVDMGMCLVGDTLQTIFYLKNTGKKTLRIREFQPSYLLGRYDDGAHKDDFLEFDYIGSRMPLDILPDSTRKLTIQYPKFGAPIGSQPGQKLARLELGLYDPEKTSTPQESDLVASKKYTLIAKRTAKYIDGFLNIINFDSVYIHSDTVTKTWRVQNSSTFSQRIEKQSFKMLSPTPLGIEFRYEGPGLPHLLPSKFNFADWLVSYYPKDLTTDSAFLELFYNPDTLNPNRWDTASVKLRGQGVVQKLDLIASSDTILFGDTIDIRDVWVGTEKEFFAVLGNSGNIPFGTKSQKLLSADNSSAAEDFSIVKAMKSDTEHIYPNESDTFIIKFSPKRMGEYTARYVLESDIDTRGIRSVPVSARQVMVYIRGQGIEPIISVKSDTVDFGNVVLHLDCPSYLTIEFPVKNIGNATLKVKYIDEYKSPFDVVGFDSIPPFSSRNLSLTFDSRIHGWGFYTSPLRIVSNVNPPNDTFRLFMRGSSVPPVVVDLSIPKDMKSKPGRRITVPLLVSFDGSNDVSIARTFDDTLIFDKTLLRYIDYELIGTASEGAPEIDISEFERGKLGISVNMGSARFLARDTLIKLLFETYLGEKISTPIAFSTPRFGDGICSKVLSPRDSNGVYSTDSVCSLNRKAVPFVNAVFQVSNISPNPANNNIKIEFEMLEDSPLEITLYNNLGEKVSDLFSTTLTKGIHSEKFSLDGFAAGIYYCRFRSGGFNVFRLIIIEM